MNARQKQGRFQRRGSRTQERAQLLEPNELVSEAGVAGVEAARVRHDEHARARRSSRASRPRRRRSRARKNIAYRLTPTNATTPGRQRAILRASVARPRSISARDSSAAVRVVRGHRFVSPMPNSASRRSSAASIKTGVRREAASSRQNGLPAAREVMPDDARSKTRVDADQQQPRPFDDDVAQSSRAQSRRAHRVGSRRALLAAHHRGRVWEAPTLPPMANEARARRSTTAGSSGSPRSGPARRAARETPFAGPVRRGSPRCRRERAEMARRP